MSELPRDGLAVFARSGCPTCTMLAPVLEAIGRSVLPFVMVAHDGEGFARHGVDVIDDGARDLSARHGIETEPTLVRFRGGVEVARTTGWVAADWRRITGLDDVGAGPPAWRPG